MIDIGRTRFRFLISRADAQRDKQLFADAATLYEEALRIRPQHAGARIQCGNMYKELGQFQKAAFHYGEARKLRCEDPDLMLQLAHLYKSAGDYAQAREYLEQSLSLAPGWSIAFEELRRVEELLSRSAALTADGELNLGRGDDQPKPGYDTVRQGLELVPSLAPRPLHELLHESGEEVTFRRLGHREATLWGNRQVLRGVEAVRGICISTRPIVGAQIFLNGLRIYSGSVQGGYVLPLQQDPARAKKYVYNYWIDFSGYDDGLYHLEVRCIDCDDRARSHSEEVVIGRPFSEKLYPDSNFLVSVDPDDHRSIEEQVGSRPSMVRSAKRALFPDGVHNVLVARTDQLGDMVASIPAFQRLREMLPNAKLVGLFNYANGELAQSLGLLDDIIIIDFPDDPLERRRVMPLDAQQKLRDRLAPYQFDIALDLAQAGVSRELLRLAGAKFTFGTGGEDWPWLSGDFLFHTRDRWNRHDFTPHSTKVLALVEALGTLLKTSAPIIRREDLSRDMLSAYGIEAHKRFALLHTGARIGFSRWPYYADLTQLLLDRTDLQLVIITEDPAFRDTMPPGLLGHDRVTLLDRRLPFNDFDALLSFATVMVGNDSGPKHLASLRGTNAVTIFSARINWTEWGQENVGTIVSRRLPCAGCALLHDAEECGKNFVCVTDIKPLEVFDAMMRLVDQPRGDAS